MVRRLLVLALGVFLPAVYCDASVFLFDDLTEGISVTVDGTPISNGGQVANLQLNAESVSFDLLIGCPPRVLCVPTTAYTRLLEPGTSVVSDLLLISFTFVDSQFTAHVQIGSDPDLPTIPGGAVDLTTIPAQGLPANPYFEDGTSQLVGTTFSGGTPLDTFYIRSDVESAVPEPASVVLLATGLALCAAVARRRKQVFGPSRERL
jgi:PEP-CTERM motif